LRVLRRFAGPLITVLILGGVVLIVVLNLDLKGASTPAVPSPTAPSGADAAAQAPATAPAPGSLKPAGFREYPIGDPVERNHMRIAAVWLPPIAMAGMPASAGADLIHLEADIHATEGNPNGFALDEFIPYLKVAYKVVPAGQEKPIHQGQLLPMVASDGLHYGASIAMPRAGAYRLYYSIEPPSDELGRHVDPVTGVAPWWAPFEVSFEWDYPGPPRAEGRATAAP
jgi:uncharacterized protein involved in high-affinity Fe2+ transport